MVHKSNIIIVLYLVKIVNTADKENVLVKLTPKDIINTFKSAISSQYLQKLADDFAIKAAKHFIDEISNKESQLVMDYYRKPRKNNPKIEHNLLNKKEALALLKEPSPDGDNLQASSQLSDSETDPAAKAISAEKLMKINGAYYRRLLGSI